MKPERVIATDKALQPFVQELNSKLVERLQDIDGSEMDLGALPATGSGMRGSSRTRTESQRNSSSSSRPKGAAGSRTRSNRRGRQAS